MNKVVAIILNYNSAKDSLKCVKYLLNQDYPDFEIVIVDNNSDVSDYQEVRLGVDEFNNSSIGLVRNEDNSGFSAGNNVGLRYAKKKNAKWALIINPDVEIRNPKYVTCMIEIVQNVPKVVVAASNIILPSGQRQNPMVEPTFFEELCWPLESIARKMKKKSSYLGENKTGYCEKVSGCCFFVQMEFVAQIGYLDENVFLYCEEPILASTVKKYGFKEWYVRELTAYHMHIKSEKGNPRKRLQLFRESRRYYWKNYSGYGKIRLFFLLLSDKIYRFFKCREW